MRGWEKIDISLQHAITKRNLFKIEKIQNKFQKMKARIQYSCQSKDDDLSVLRNANKVPL